MPKLVRNWPRRLLNEGKDQNLTKKADIQDLAGSLKVGFDSSKIKASWLNPIDNEKATRTWGGLKVVDITAQLDNEDK